MVALAATDPYSARSGRGPAVVGAIFSIRFSPEERKAMDTVAERVGETASAWARRVLLEAACDSADGAS